MKWLRQSPWPGVLAVLLGIALAELHRGCDARRLSQADQDMLVRRMDLRFDWLKVKTESIFYWARNASPILKVQPPMELDDTWPQKGPVRRPLDPPGLYAAEVPPREDPCSNR